MSHELNQAKRASYASGLRAEAVAALWLRAKFFRILARRYRAQGGEIDIVACRGRTIAFVEVKARDTLDDAATSITPQKQKRLSRAAAGWLAAHPWAATYTLRADAIFIAPGRLPKHIEAAIELQLG
jgi:putative endonuclease